MQDKRPNILFAIADDASHMSAYGQSFLSTPAFDRVAAQGVIFTNAFTTNPKCAPSRASILTGRHTWELEEACNHWNVWPAKFPVYPDVLADNGYFVGYTGKGWGPGDWKREGRTTNPAGPSFDRHTLDPPSPSISAKDYAQNFVGFLNERPQETPFCFWYGGHEPHRPYHGGEGREHGKEVPGSQVPSYFPSDEVVRDDLADYAFEVEWFDRHLGRMLDELERRGELENTLVVVTSDNGMPFPRVKGQMYEDDFRLPMAMMWLGASQRFGESADPPQTVSAMEVSAHSPLPPDLQNTGRPKTADTRTVRGGRILTDLISFIDIAPTILDAARLPAHEAMTGRSFLALFTGPSTGRHDAARDRVCMGRERHDLGREGDLGYPVRCIRTEEYLYVRNLAPERWPAGNPETGYTGCDSSPTKDLIIRQHEGGEDRYWARAFGKRPPEELYRITTDPECLHNLAAEPQYAGVTELLWAELQGYLRAQNDPRILGFGEIFDTYEYVGDPPHSWANYVAGTWHPQRY